VPRGLSRPDPPLTDGTRTLEPLHTGHAPELRWVLDGDPGIARYTRIPDAPGPQFLGEWLGRYERGWDDGSCAGFAVRDEAAGACGFAGFVELELEARQGEIGYAVAPSARGRGVARGSLELVTRWGFDELALERIELRIDPSNSASIRVAERAGFRLEGVLRNVYFKEGARTNIGVWSRLASD
jgi:RimJ/RimL family protein N-acetyltransferase